MSKQNPALPTAQLREMIVGLGLAGLPHGFNLPSGPVALFYLMLGYRYLAIGRPALLPGKGLLLLATLAVGAAVWLQSGGIFGKSAGSALLLAGTGLKLLEMRSRRDLHVAVAVAYLLALTQFLFSQAIPMAVYLLAIVILLTAVLIGMHCGTAVVPLPRRLRLSTILTLQALPLAALLFVLAPRLPGPLWNLPQDKANTTGLSDRLEPGSITELGSSDALAFRVDFAGPRPPQNRLYWRGPVFWWTDGSRWEMRELPALSSQVSAYAGMAVDYSMVLEPHGHKWLLALDLPQGFPSDSHLTGDFQLVAKNEVNERRLLRLRSYPAYRYGDLSVSQRRLGLQLPKGQPEPLRQLVAGWREGRSDAEVVQQALLYFHDNDFHYTLHPPLLPDRPVERFLLETRRGFCEHYATSFVVLMRLAAIPARVVTGYQGGQWNTVGNFLEVKQSDAHAWAEVWLNGKGWARVDPTAAVAPERIERPVEAMTASLAGREGRQSGLNNPSLMAWAMPVRLFWANVNHGWHRWVLGYDRDTRQRLLQWLGTGNWPKAVAWLSLALALAAMPFLWELWRDRRLQARDPVAQCYQRFCAKLGALGLPRRPNEGPEAYAARAARSLPHLAEKLGEITAMYTSLRYGGVPAEELLTALRRKVRQLK